MRDEHLTHQCLFGQTPRDFSLRMEQTLNGLKEEKAMKKGISGVLVIAVLLLLLCAAAFAAVNGFGLDWYYKNIFSSRPMPNNVDQMIQNDLYQTSEHPFLHLRAESAVWLPKGYDDSFPGARILEVLISIKPKNPTRYEVHSWEDMNADGYRNDREEDYIQTPKGMGPVPEMMMDPEKTLLLYGGHNDLPFTVYGAPIHHFAWHYSHDPDGNVLCYYSFPIVDTILNHMKTRYANAENMMTITYEDDSWLWNAKGDIAGHTQTGIISFQIKLPE